MMACEIASLIVNGISFSIGATKKKIFEMIDSNRYTKGWFAIRTTQNHRQVGKLRIVRFSAK